MYPNISYDIMKGYGRADWKGGKRCEVLNPLFYTIKKKKGRAGRKGGREGGQGKRRREGREGGQGKGALEGE